MPTKFPGLYYHFYIRVRILPVTTDSADEKERELNRRQLGRLQNRCKDWKTVLRAKLSTTTMLPPPVLGAMFALGKRAEMLLVPRPLQVQKFNHATSATIKNYTSLSLYLPAK